ncbi:MAG: hypothetical protein JW991_04050 [Candidatus Pacebacteria bacterium]|nr:hypothetical protein [Candidatus Paceibacterota bacterium]
MINLKEDYKDYLALLSILTFGLLAFVWFGYDRTFQSVVIIILAAAYVFWGAAHHLLKGDFHFRVLLEYLAVAFFGTGLVLILLGRA